MSLINANPYPENTTLPAFPMSENDVWWRWLIVVELLRYGPALCVCIGTVGVALSTIVWIRLHRHLPATLLYLLVALMLELLPVYMHCGSYSLKQVILSIVTQNYAVCPVGFHYAFPKVRCSDAPIRNPNPKLY